MRPREFPAEDRDCGGVSEMNDGASMRPREFPAEDFHDGHRLLGKPVASMRPREFPAEDLLTMDVTMQDVELQ